MKKLLPILSIIVLYSCSNEKGESRQVKQYTIEQFYKSTEAFGGSFNYDDSKLLFTSNEGGIFNCWETDLESGNTTARTTSTKESIFSNGNVPGTNNILYSEDKGGNENSHIYLLKDTIAKDLTPGATENEIKGYGQILQFLDKYVKPAATNTPKN